MPLRLATLPLLAGALAAAVPAVAAAQAPTGRLYADGSGAVALEGGLLAYGVGAGRPLTLRVVDRLGDAQVVVAGVPQLPRRAGRGAEYRVRTTERWMVSGGRVSLDVRGDRLSVSVAGLGWARLSGRGRYVLNDVAWSRWSGRGVRIAPLPAPPRRAAPVPGAGAAAPAADAR